MSGAYLWFLPRAFFYARGPWVRTAPGLPCALINRRGSWLHASLGRHASRERGSLPAWLFEMFESPAPSLRAKRSNPGLHRQSFLGPGLLRFARNDDDKIRLNLSSYRVRTFTRRTLCIRIYPTSMERAGVLLLPACGVETSKARSEKVGMRGCLHKFGGSEYAESPPHPKFAFANFDLSPQAGRGESAARRSAKAPTLRARHGRRG